MNQYTVTRITGQPDWSQIPLLEVGNILWLPDAGVRMKQQICYDENALYIHQFCTEQHIRAEHTEPLAMVCEDSCMEFFFCPDPNSQRYFNFEWNLNGCLYLGLFSGHGFSVRLRPNDPAELFQFRSAPTQDGWEIFYQIPLSFIQLFFPDFRLDPGSAIRANCYKCGDLTLQPHYLSWNPCTSETPNFHRPVDFGQIVLE